jgi:DNA segregation ATPase FtsK/SpoIIIE-like protein
VGDDQILNTVILNKLNVFSVKTYEDVKQFLFQILGSDQKEFIREFTWLVFRKAAAEDKFCGLFAKLLSEIQKEYPVILEEMRKLHTTYLDIWKVSETSDSSPSAVDRRCRLGYSQFLAELTALRVLESDTMKLTLETLKGCIQDCLGKPEHVETVEEYMDCLRQLCGSRVPKDVKLMIREMLVDNLISWIAEPRESVPGLSSKSRFACMDLRDHLIR